MNYIKIQTDAILDLMNAYHFFKSRYPDITYNPETSTFYLRGHHFRGFKVNKSPLYTRLYPEYALTDTKYDIHVFPYTLDKSPEDVWQDYLKEYNNHNTIWSKIRSFLPW